MSKNTNSFIKICTDPETIKRETSKNLSGIFFMDRDVGLAYKMWDMKFVDSKKAQINDYDDSIIPVNWYFEEILARMQKINLNNFDNKEIQKFTQKEFNNNLLITLIKFKNNYFTIYCNKNARIIFINCVVNSGYLIYEFKKELIKYLFTLTPVSFSYNDKVSIQYPPKNVYKSITEKVLEKYFDELKVILKGSIYKINTYPGSKKIFLDFIMPDSGYPNKLALNVRSSKYISDYFAPILKYDSCLACLDIEIIVRCEYSNYPTSDYGTIYNRLKIKNGIYREDHKNGTKVIIKFCDRVNPQYGHLKPTFNLNDGLISVFDSIDKFWKHSLCAFVRENDKMKLIPYFPITHIKKTTNIYQIRDNNLNLRNYNLFKIKKNQRQFNKIMEKIFTVEKYLKKFEIIAKPREVKKVEEFYDCKWKIFETIKKYIYTNRYFFRSIIKNSDKLILKKKLKRMIGKSEIAKNILKYM